MIKIRHYQEKDKENVRFTCLNSDGPCDSSEKMKFFILNTFCDYFIEQESENCFVAADENDKAIGYVICAENYDKYFECFVREYVPRFAEDAEDDRNGAIHSADLQKEFKDEYPAHLHIDVNPEYQRMGVGHKMVDALCEHLRNKGIKGVMLTTGVDNVKGRGFYKKYGFTELKISGEDVAYGIKL